MSKKMEIERRYDRLSKQSRLESRAQEMLQVLQAVERFLTDQVYEAGSDDIIEADLLVDVQAIIAKATAPVRGD